MGIIVEILYCGAAAHGGVRPGQVHDPFLETVLTLHTRNRCMSASLEYCISCSISRRTIAMNFSAKARR